MKERIHSALKSIIFVFVVNIAAVLLTVGYLGGLFGEIPFLIFLLAVLCVSSPCWFFVKGDTEYPITFLLAACVSELVFLFSEWLIAERIVTDSRVLAFLFSEIFVTVWFLCAAAVDLIFFFIQRVRKKFKL
ncbi:MAG: hypothetical protein MJ102_01830 [Clostridia bacterium]|nr:hypothetical protein [Clostridia bacterium]